MRPLQISPETAQRLAKELKVPLEHLMHMPQHILLQKLAELAKQSGSEGGKSEESESASGKTEEK
ncbi:YycC family protein [Paenibacillus sp. P26]|nr:YycC family protein [Paenibacillus sp. P26]UUZ90246.1 YycC family protein [Paenibacillus sp. P25]